jgi:hypothetical protein
MRKTILTTLLCLLAGTAQAHEVWVERDGTGAARIYLGEPADPLPLGGDPEFEKLKAPTVLGQPAVTFTRRAGFLEAKVPAGDVRVWDDKVFAPWGDEGKKEGVVYYARAGRADTRALLPLEIAPLAANGNRFALLLDGKPVANTKVTIITPEKWSRSIMTGTQGEFDVPLREKGRYLLTAAIQEDGEPTGAPVQTLHRITTTTFTTN